MPDSSGYFFDDLEVGMKASFAKTITEADLLLFAAVSGDNNPIHLNQEYAEQTMYKGRIGHGLLTASLISNVIGTKLPGPGSIYIKQNLVFVAPVKLFDTVHAYVSIDKLIPEKKRAVLKTECFVNEELVLTGDALVVVPTRETTVEEKR